jgi:uncharacterized protein YbaP (TraB family)
VAWIGVITAEKVRSDSILFIKPIAIVIALIIAHFGAIGFVLFAQIEWSKLLDNQLYRAEALYIHSMTSNRDDMKTVFKLKNENNIKELESFFSKIKPNSATKEAREKYDQIMSKLGKNAQKYFKISIWVFYFSLVLSISMFPFLVG